MKKFLLLLKIIISLSLLFYALRNIQWAAIDYTMLWQQSFLSKLLFCASLVVLQIGFISLRWHQLHKMFAMSVPFKLSWRLSWICQFFSKVLPGGSLGGAGFRVLQLRQRGYNLKYASICMLLDQGMAACSLFAILCITGMQFLELSATIFYLAIVVIVIGVFLVTWFWKNSYTVFLYSSAIHLCNISILYTLAVAFDTSGSFYNWMFLGGLMILATVLPVSISGWGIRESLALKILPYVGLAGTEAVAISVLFGLLHLLVAATGGMIYLLHKEHKII